MREQERRRLRRPETLLLVLSLIAVLATAGHGQQADTDASERSGEEIFFESVEVNVVNVDVYVTDKKGKRVTGLNKDDFELFEDGKPIEVTNFYAVADGTPQIEPSSAAPVADATTSAAPQPAPHLAPSKPEEQRLYLVIYFDNLFLRPFSRNKVIDHSRQFLLDNIRDDDQLMLVTFERSLHIRHPFTSDRRAILDEMDKLRKLSAFAPQQQTERRDVIRRIDTSRDALEARSHVDSYAEQVFFDLKTSINALKEIVDSLAGLPGRKALLYLSDGIPMTAAEDLFYLIDEKYQDGATSQLAAATYRARRQFNDLTSHANANRVSFYTIEASGLTAHASLSAEYGHRDTSIIAADVVRESNREQPLMIMADATGGLAALNTNDFDGAFERIGEDFNNYYSLGYAPVHATSGRYYTIDVKVKRPGLEVRHRSGYRDKTPDNRVNEGTLAALIHGAESNPLDLELEFDRVKPANDRNYLLPTLVKIPLASLTLIPQEDTHHGSVRVALGVIDEEGAISPLHQQSVPITIPSADLETALRQSFIYEVELRMKSGLQAVAVGVRDDLSGSSSFIRRTVRVGV
ncbi:MAG: VWA domain-containing protein [Acidobacteriota bacterium]|nr:VWA domain-containing protein [Acidobacteriota bacterium]